MFKFKKVVPTVAAALQGFHKAIADLKAVKEHHDAEAQKHDGIIAMAEDAVQDAINAAQAAYERTVSKAASMRDAAEKEAREAAVAIARVEAFIGL